MAPRKKKPAIRKLRITLRKSVIGYSERQKATVKALGLHRMGQTVEKDDSPVLRGMVAKVSHLVDVQEVEG